MVLSQVLLFPTMNDFFSPPLGDAGRSAEAVPASSPPLTRLVASYFHNGPGCGILGHAGLWEAGLVLSGFSVSSASFPGRCPVAFSPFPVDNGGSFGLTGSSGQLLDS